MARDFPMTALYRAGIPTQKESKADQKASGHILYNNVLEIGYLLAK